MSENNQESPEFLFGYEAQKVILEALGIDVENKKFAIQHIQINLGQMEFPIVTMMLAPYSDLFKDERFQELLKRANIAAINPAIFEQIGEKVREELFQIMKEAGEL